MEKKKGYKKTAIGWIPEDWKCCKIAELTDEHKQGFYTKEEYSKDGVHLIRITDLHNPVVDFTNMPKVSIDEKTFQQFKVKAGDFLFARSGAIGRYGILPVSHPKAVFASYLIRFRFNSNKTLNQFIGSFYESQFCLRQINSITQGSSNININANNIKSLSIPLPPLPEQTKIADILTTVDDKISSIDSQIQQTEQLKKGLMEKLLTEGIGHTEFKETEIGRIPVGWDVSTLAEAKINIIDGDRGTNYPKQDDFYEDGFCLFLTAKNVSKSGFRFDETQYISEERDGLLRKGKLVRNDIVITTRGTVGNIAWYNANVKLENIRINSGMALIRKSFENVDSMFLYLLFRSHLVQKQIKLIAFGSAQPQLTIKEIKKFRIVLPPLSEQKQIATILSTVDDKLDILTQKKSHYQTLKKGLSQQLLTGQMRVKV
jgi:type I restriction enzyme S subunit